MLDFNTDDSQVLKFVYLIIVYTTSKKVYYHVYKTSVYILCLCLNAVVSSYTSLLVSLTYCLIKRNNLFHTIYYLKLFLKLWYLQMEDLIEHNDFHSTTYRCVIIHYCVFLFQKKNVPESTASHSSLYEFHDSPDANNVFKQFTKVMGCANDQIPTVKISPRTSPMTGEEVFFYNNGTRARRSLFSPIYPEVGRDIDVHSEVDKEIDLHPEMGREIDVPSKLNGEIGAHPQLDREIDVRQSKTFHRIYVLVHVRFAFVHI